MKFLCVPCDEAMRLTETRGPDQGSMTVIFKCPTCDRQTAMLTNSMETQVVRSLGVDIKPRTAAASNSANESASTPANEPEDAPANRNGAGGAYPAAGASSGSKCPFTGVVADAYENNGMNWSDAARARAERIPVFARQMAMKGVEDYAREKGYREVSEAVLDEAREYLGL